MERPKLNKGQDEKKKLVDGLEVRKSEQTGDFRITKNSCNGST